MSEAWAQESEKMKETVSLPFRILRRGNVEVVDIMSIALKEALQTIFCVVDDSVPSSCAGVPQQQGLGGGDRRREPVGQE